MFCQFLPITGPRIHLSVDNASGILACVTGIPRNTRIEALNRLHPFAIGQFSPIMTASGYNKGMPRPGRLEKINEPV